MSNKSFKEMLILVAILLLATYLRIYQLDTIPNGLIPDEAIRGYDAYSLARTGADSFGVQFPLFLRGYDDYVAALYSYIAAILMMFLDISVFSLRLTSAFVGILTIAAVYQVIQYSFGRMAAIIGSFLLTISPWHILTSRTGLEWSLFVLGINLSIVLAFYGFNRPRMLIAAGVVAGLTLYSYSPVKAFFPILLIGFVIFYRHELYRQKRVALVAMLALILLALPIYMFSFSAEGMKRFDNVYQGAGKSLLEVMPQLIRNYFSYFSLDFLFGVNYEGDGAPEAINRLRVVGLFYWFELPLMVLGLVRVFFLRNKRAWFMLYWLIVAAVGINLHDASPAPHLWLTVLPVPQALAGTGFSWLLVFVQRFSIKSTGSQLQTPRKWPYSVGIVLLLTLSLGVLIHFAFMVHDLFYKFPNYGAGAWFFGRGPSILAMESLKDRFDDANLSSEDLSSSSYLLFYSQYDPASRHADLAQYPEKTWQNIGDYNIGDVRNYIQEPGCHLILTSVVDAQDLKINAPHLITWQKFNLPDGNPVYGLYVLPTPSSNIIRKDGTFDNKILLQGVAPVSPSDVSVSLRPGQAICLIVQWQALQDVYTDYTVFAHLIGLTNPVTGSPLWAQHDDPPAYGEKPTSTWRIGDIIQDAHILMTPVEMPAGQYNLEIGLYDPVTGERLPVVLEDGSSGTSVTLMEFNVQ